MITYFRTYYVIQKSEAMLYQRGKGKDEKTSLLQTFLVKLNNIATSYTKCSSANFIIIYIEIIIKYT